MLDVNGMVRGQGISGGLTVVKGVKSLSKPLHGEGNVNIDMTATSNENMAVLLTSGLFFGILFCNFVSTLGIMLN